ncbi:MULTISPECIES: sensor histidine kinase [unclassified Ornithinimicrobium]|uniref:sensor histidine kinase n=1 Tax=unclassified Ornithinimicrobium TaxID=2615080 RepID=UPI00385376D0
MDTISTTPSQPGEETLAVLHAVQDLSDADDAVELLRRALRAACRLAGARVGVVGVSDENHPTWFSQVLTRGLAADDPRARSLLELHPDDDPPDPVLRATLRLNGQVYGALLLTDWPTTPGTRERAWLQVLASAVELRLDTLRQHRVSELHERVTRTVWELNRTMVDEVDLEITLPLLVERVLELTAARVVALVGTRPDGEHRILAATGSDAGAVVAELSTDLTEVMGSASAHHWSTTTVENLTADAGGGSTSLVPLDTRTGDPVVLAVHDWRPASGVSARQVRDVLSALALQASVILDREQREREHDLLTVLEDRDRIARDLHDLVIQRLFAVGLTLQGASRRANPEVVERLEGAVAELDQTIRDIRATIFELRHRPGAGSFRADLRQLVESYASTLGFAPVVQLVGPLDTAADDEVQTQVLMVVREALSNVARHAHATSVVVEVEADTDVLTVSVRDDGVGLSDSAGESGLGNVRARATERGGSVELVRTEPHGTLLRWSVPV